LKCSGTWSKILYSLTAIEHRHDFTWELTRFSVSAADDYLNAAFPACLILAIHATTNWHIRRRFSDHAEWDGF